MKRGVVLGGVWLVGVVIAVTLAFAAVARVASGVAPNDVSHLSKTEIDAQLTGGTTPAPGATTSTTARATTTTSRPASSSSTTPATLSPSGSTSPTTGGTALTAPPITAWSTTSIPAPPATATTVPQPAPRNTVTTSQGGTVYTRCTGPDTIEYVAAVPRAGYARTVDIEAPTGVRQTFVNANHLSNIQAECSDGHVHAQVEEETEGE